MTIRKQMKAEVLKDIIKLPENIKDDDLLEVTIREVKHISEVGRIIQPKRGSEELIRFFQSRIRTAAPELTCTEEVFSLDEVEWRDLNEVMAHFEEAGYGVKISQQDDRVRIKILWRYV